MSEEIRAADALQAEIARLRTEVRDLAEINAQQRRTIEAQIAARWIAEADAAQLRTAALAYVRAATYDDRARLRAELEVLATVEHPGVLLLKELEAVRKVVELARYSYDVQDYPAEEGDLYKALVAYDKAKAGSG